MEYVFEGFFKKKNHRKRSVVRAFKKIEQMIDGMESVAELDVLGQFNNRLMGSIRDGSEHLELAWQLYCEIRKKLKNAREDSKSSR